VGRAHRLRALSGVEPVAAREFLIDAQADGTIRFTHVEDVRGVLFPLFRAVMGSAIQRHHDALNAALSERAEGRPASTSP
jgi:hypothetical protein